MTNRQKNWLKIAEAYGTNTADRTNDQRFVAQRGLCFALRWTVGYEARDEFADLVCVTFAPNACLDGVWAWPIDGHDEERCDFACLMAAMSDADYNALIIACRVNPFNTQF